MWQGVYFYTDTLDGSKIKESGKRREEGRGGGGGQGSLCNAFRVEAKTILEQKISKLTLRIYNLMKKKCRNLPFELLILKQKNRILCYNQRLKFDNIVWNGLTEPMIMILDNIYKRK